MNAQYSQQEMAKKTALKQEAKSQYEKEQQTILNASKKEVLRQTWTSWKCIWGRSTSNVYLERGNITSLYRVSYSQITETTTNNLTFGETLFLVWAMKTNMH